MAEKNSKDSRIPPYPYERYKMTGLFEYEDRFADIIDMITNGQTRSITEFIKNRVKSNPNTTILELGFGEGYALEELATIVCPENLYGIDLQTPTERIGQIIANHKGIHLKQGNVHRLVKLYTTKHGLQRFDIIIASNLAMWLHDPVDALLRQGYQLLKPNGVLIINTYNLENVMPDQKDRERFIHATTRAGWIWRQRGTCYDIAVRKLENQEDAQRVLNGLHQIPHNHAPTREQPVAYQYVGNL